MIKKLFLVTISLIFVAVMSGCSGGDSDSGGSVVYTGKTTPAVITEDNAKEIVVESINAQDSQEFGSIFGAAEIEEVGSAQYYALAARLSSVVESIRASSSYYSAATETIAGSCGGSVVASSSSETSVSFVFSNFCDAADFDTGGAIYNGSMSMTFSDELFSISMSNLSVKGVVDGAQVDVAMSGTITMRFSANFDLSITMSLVAQDNITQTSSKIENLTIATNSAGLSIDGRVYSSDYGYVDLETITPINYDFSGVPTSGELKVTGANGSNASILFTGSTYTVSVDADGDGAVDTTETGSTSNLAISSF